MAIQSSEATSCREVSREGATGMAAWAMGAGAATSAAVGFGAMAAASLSLSALNPETRSLLI